MASGDDDFLNKVYSFEEEEERDVAIRLLQRCYKAKLARKFLKSLVRDNYIKIYDKINGVYAYKNRTTGAVSFDKPVFLGDDDLPTPKQLQAPGSYDSGIDLLDCDGAALVISCNTFKHDELPPLGPAISVDHMNISEILSHDYICKMKMENVISLKNPTCSAFVDAIERLRQVCKRESFVFIYICTHVVELDVSIRAEKEPPKSGATKDKKGGGGKNGKLEKQKSTLKSAPGSLAAGLRRASVAPSMGGPSSSAAGKKKEDTFFCFEDTQWKDPRTVANTSISLTKIMVMINRLACTKKTIALNYAHVREKPKSLFGNRKHLYPPSDMLYRLANGTNAAVLGSCTIGMSLLECINHNAEYIAEVNRVRNLAIMAALKNAKNEDFFAVISRKVSKKVTMSLSQKEPTKKMSKRRRLQMEEAALEADRDPIKEMHDRILARFREDWKIPPDLEVVVTPKPSPPHAVFLKDESTDFKYEVKVPSHDEMLQYDFQVLNWRYKRLLEPSKNLYSRFSTWWNASRLAAPHQQSIVMGETHSIFGKAVLEGLSGGASTPENYTVSVQALFDFVKKAFDKVLAEIALADEEDNALHPGHHHRGKHQCPVLVVPLENAAAAQNPVCYRVGPPTQPERPFIVVVGLHEVTLQWYNPLFDGVQASKYRIFMRNVSRCFNEWRPITYNGDITKMKYKVRDLPSGVQCTFRIEGYNNGGWGQPSEETPFITPGEEFSPLPFMKRWTKLSLGGPLAIIDRLNLYPNHRDDYITGLAKISGFAARSNGFHKGMIQVKVAEVGMHALKRFPNDRDIIALAFRVLACAMHGPKDRKVRLLLTQGGIVAICEEYANKFRIDPYIVGAIVDLRKWISIIGAIPEQVHEVPIEKVESSDEEEEEDEGGKND